MLECFLTLLTDLVRFPTGFSVCVPVGCSCVEASLCVQLFHKFIVVLCRELRVLYSAMPSAVSKVWFVIEIPRGMQLDAGMCVFLKSN